MTGALLKRTIQQNFTISVPSEIWPDEKGGFYKQWSYVLVNEERKLTSKFYSFQRFDKKKMEKHEEVK